VLANATLVMFRARHANDPVALDQKLSTSDHLHLDTALPEMTRSQFLSALDFSSPERMDRTVLALLEQMVTVLETMPDEQRVPRALLNRLLHFVADEVAPQEHARRS